MVISKLTLGTAQLGLDYGIANRNGKPDFNTSIRILNYSYEHGINSFDTAPSYGNSEEIIGSFITSHLKLNINNLIIMSKLSGINIKEILSFDNVYNYIKTQLIQSLENLKIPKIPIYLIHKASDLSIKSGLIVECLNQLKEEGLIDRIGISIYNPNEVEEALKFKEINVIQVPINLFDHRLINTGLLQKLKMKKYLIFARSIYLQGLLFKSVQNLPKSLEYAKNFLLKLRNLTENLKVNILKLAFLFVRDLPEITSLIIGIERVDQIEENLKMLKEEPLLKEIRDTIIEEFSEVPEKIINPSLWNK